MNGPGLSPNFTVVAKQSFCAFVVGLSTRFRTFQLEGFLAILRTFPDGPAFFCGLMKVITLLAVEFAVTIQAAFPL